jgi:hypothetical protein
MRRDLSLQLDVIEIALAESKPVLGANAKRLELTIDDVIDKNFVSVAR